MPKSVIIRIGNDSAELIKALAKAEGRTQVAQADRIIEAGVTALRKRRSESS